MRGHKVVLFLSLLALAIAACPETPCAAGKCCSKWGYCGTADSYCNPDKGCQANCATSTSSSGGGGSPSSGSSGSSGGSSGGSSSGNGGNGGNVSNKWTGQPTDYKNWNIVKDAYGKNNRQVVDDPLGSGQVLRVNYPQGSFKPSASPVGGTGFYATPVDLSSATTVQLNYSLYFPADFEFVKGGKLPGLYAGHESCSGGKDASECISTRFMWRTNGMGEMYLYVDKSATQGPGFCDIPPKSECNPAFGSSLGRGSFSFKRGGWTSVSQTMSLGPLNSATGILRVVVNDQLVISYNQINYRTHQFSWKGIDFETFFGGGDSSWASPKDQYTLFKDFSISLN